MGFDSLLDSGMMALFLESIYTIKIITVTITMYATTMKPFDILSIGFVDRGAEHKIIYIYIIIIYTVCI